METTASPELATTHIHGRLRLLLPVVLVAALAAFALFARFAAAGSALAYFDDDFFYYLKIAQNIASGRGSTFDGIHLTNGYHPLWLWLLSALALFLHGSAMLYAVVALTVVSTTVIFAAARSCLMPYAPTALAAESAAGLLALGALVIINGGMEIVLALPLLLCLCACRLSATFRWRPASVVTVGLLAAACILARLDAGLFIALFFALEFASNREARRPVVLAACITAVPLALYLGANTLFFHTLLPISGDAKELRTGHSFSRTMLWSFFHGFDFPQRYFLRLPALLLLGAALLWLLLRGWGRLSRAARPITVALLALPFLYLLVLGFLSDWPLWNWYLYPLVLAELGAAMVLLSGPLTRFRTSSRSAWRWSAAAAAIVCAMALSFATQQWRHVHQQNKLMFSIYLGAADIRAFAQTHPGVYAMGDRAGTPGYLLPDPVVQLEGLVMDEPYLNNLRQQRSVNSVLRAYGVRFYVATNPDRDGACYRVTEPLMGGPSARKMHGLLCQPPVAEFQHNGYRTLIFDLGNSQPVRHGD